MEVVFMKRAEQTTCILFKDEEKRTMQEYLIILLTIAMGIAVIEDIRRLKIPNWVTFPTMLLALAAHSVTSGVDGLLFSAWGLAAGIGLFIIPYLMGGMGAGDAKLMGAAGAVLGAKGILMTSILVVLFGGAYGAILLALNRRYAISFVRRLWATIKTFVLTKNLILIPPETEEKRPVLRYAIPITVGTFCHLAIEHNGYDIFKQLL
jgi:prepilin peptidase CpaA